MGCYETDLKIMSVSLMKYFLKIYVNVSVLPWINPTGCVVSEELQGA